MSEKDIRIQTLNGKGLSEDQDNPNVLNLSSSTESSSGSTKLSDLPSTSFLEDSDLLVLSRSSDKSGVYDQSFSIRIGETTLSQSIQSSTLPINILSDVDVQSPAGHQVLAYNGSQWTNYSWDYLMKDKFQIIEGVGPPTSDCDGDEWKEVNKIYVCQKEGKIVFYFQS
jgi:hypothetical protein